MEQFKDHEIEVFFKEDMYELPPVYPELDCLMVLEESRC